MKKQLLLGIFMAVSGIAFTQNPTIQTIINTVNIDSLMYRSEEISGYRGVVVNGVTDTIKSRNKNRPGNELCFRYARDKFISWGYQVDSMTFGATGKNLWAIKPGYLYPNEEVIICGHYDGMPNAVIAPAADDDGSGTAAVLEAARVLAPYNFEYTIMFVLWDEEEYGLAGSGAYASAAQSSNDTIRAVVNMDAIAHDSDNDSVARVHVRPPGNSEEIGDTVVAVNTNYNIGLDLILVNPGATYSDHNSFWTRNFGAVLIIQDWEGDPNPHYHIPSDSVVYFRQPYFHKLARLSIGSAATLAVPFDTTGLGLEDNWDDPALRLYPNPVKETLNVKWQKNFDYLTITGISGKVFYSKSLVDANKFQSFDVSNLPAGMYFISLWDGTRMVSRKFIK